VSGTAIDFSDLGARPVAPLTLDFSDLGGKPVSATPQVAAPQVTMQTVPESTLDQVGAHIVDRVASMGTHALDAGKSIANQVYDVSAPNLADQLQKHFRGEPNDLDKIPSKQLIAFLSAGGFPEAEAGELAPVTEAAAHVEDAADAVGDHIPVPGAGIPRTLSGESALRQILTGQDNANLLKIAKSRGLNVTSEAQLKAGVSDPLLINKIVGDFSQDELNEVGSRYLENSRFAPNSTGHQFGDIGPEAWKTKSLQAYFPDVKIPAATLNRVGKAVSNAAPVAGDDSLLNALQESLRRVKAKSVTVPQ
jgi:hypothetical protein